MEILRTSSYLIPVKLESAPGRYMLIHGYTGAADIVPETLLRKIDGMSLASDISETLLQKLLKRGYVTYKTKEEESAYVQRIAKALHKECNILGTSFTWVVTYNCNFRCPYCFEARNEKNGTSRIVFTKEQVDIAYEAMNRIQPHEKLRKQMITLYGGEPLMAENKEIVHYIVREGRKRGYTFIAVTNGYEIDSFEDILGENGIYRLQITVDGPKEIHNQRRIHYNDYNTFDKIISNIQLALDKGVRVVVRMNSDAKNINQYNDLKEYFSEKGFLANPNFYTYVARLRDYYEITPFEHKNIDFMSPKLFNSMQKQIGVLPFTVDTGYYKEIYDALLNKRSIPFRPVACKAQSSECVLDPLGNIYPCWEVVGKQEHIKGRYTKDGIIWNEEILNKWQNTDITYLEQCRECKYALLCGGGCPYHRMLGRSEQQCYIFKNILNLAINKAYADLYN